MNNPLESPSLRAEIADAIVKIPKGLVPASLKALDRLVGAAVDIPVAWLAQRKGRIEAQTEAFKLVESSIGKAAAIEAGADEATVKRAVNVLVRKEYRKQTNREAVAAVMLEDLSQSEASSAAQSTDSVAADLDEDWLNVFERYAEDASTERMQNLWGRVLAGELRKPGRYSSRTLRFLSEFSQADALLFSDFCKSTFGEVAPKSLVKPEDMSDIRGLLSLESAGLIHGADGLGLKNQRTFNADGHAFIVEGDMTLFLHGEPDTQLDIPVCVLTPLGSELLGLLQGRDMREAARAVANAIRTPQIQSAYIAVIIRPGGQVQPMEILWQKEIPAGAVPEG